MTVGACADRVTTQQDVNARTRANTREVVTLDAEPVWDAGRRPRAAEADLDVDASTAADSGAGIGNGHVVFVGEVPNARDLGGTPLVSGQEVAFGELYRGAPLARLSPDGCSELAALGIRTVIDLRVPSEVMSVPESACVTDGAHVVSAPLPIPYQVSASDYIAILDAEPSMAAVFEQLGDAAAYPIYMHCTYGRDRTGVVAAVVLLALGAAREQIVAEYSLSIANVGGYPGSLTAALDEIDRRGGIESYLDALGVSEQQRQVMRASAVVSAP